MHKLGQPLVIVGYYYIHPKVHKLGQPLCDSLTREKARDMNAKPQTPNPKPQTPNPGALTQEKDVDAHHSALALERYLKEIGVHEVWIRGYSEAKLLDADPAFHSFQDVKHIQTCDVFIALINQVTYNSTTLT